MSKIEKAKNHNGETIFPVTVADAVLMGNGQTLKGKLSELGSEVDAFGTTLGVNAETVNIDIIEGKYVNINGSLVSLDICWYSQPIYVSKNTLVSAHIYTSSSVAAISKYENGKYTPLKIYQGEKGDAYVSYAVLEDMQVVFSGYTQTKPTIKKSAIHGAVEEILYRISNTIQMNGELPNEITDLNGIDVNTGYIVYDSNRVKNIANIPIGIAGFAVYTFVAEPSVKSIRMQFLQSNRNESFYRCYWDGWGEWHNISSLEETTIQSGGIISALVYEEFKDIRTFPKNRIYNVLNANVSSQIANIPAKAKNGFSVITISADKGESTSLQILFDIYRNIYISCLWGSSWSDWVNIKDIKNDIELANINISNTERFIDAVIGVTEISEVSIERNEGYINKEGKVIEGIIGFYSNPIHVEGGTIIEYKASASSVFSAISKVENGKILPLVLGITNAYEVKNMYYIAEKDIDVIFSGYSESPSIVKLHVGDSLPAKVSNLIEKVTSMYGGYESITPKFSNVGYINNKGIIQSITAYNYSEGIELKKGQSIIVKTNYEYMTIVSLISLRNEDGTYTSVAAGGSVAPDEKGYWSYSYKTNKDCEIVLTTRNISIDESYAIIIPNLLESVDSIEKEVDNLKKEIGRDKYGLQEIDAENPLLRINTSAGLTSAIRSWGFVGDSLSSGEIWGFIYTDINLTAQEAGYKINSNGVKEVSVGYNISQPIEVKGIYPTLYVSSEHGEIVIVKSDAGGSIGQIVNTTTSNNKTHTNYKELSSGNYVRISYPIGVTIAEHQERYVDNNYDISWGQFLCRLCGSEGYNYSKGGRQAKTIVNGTTDRDLGQLLKDTQKQAYTIALGQNDYGYINGVGDDTHYKELGSAEEGSADLVEPSNPSSHGDSFVGYYSELICRIKNRFNDSLIFLMTCPNKDGSRDEISAVIRQIYEHYNKVYPNQIFLIDLNLYAKGMTDDFNLNGLHLNSQGYLLAAYIVCTYVDWILRNNIKALNGLPLIGTGAKPK